MENSGIWRQWLSMLLLLQGLSSGAQSCPTIHNPVDCSTSGFPIYHQLPEPAQTHVHWANHRILCRPLLLLPSIFPNIRVFSNGKSNHNSKSETIASTCSSLPSNIPLSSWFITGPIQWGITSHQSEWPSLKSLQISVINAGEGVGERGPLLHCWWECKLVQPYGEQYADSGRSWK